MAINFVDLLFAVVIIIIGSYLSRRMHDDDAWFAICLQVLGAALILCVTLSAFGVAFISKVGFLGISASLGVIIGLFELAFGIATLVMRDNMESYLLERYSEPGGKVGDNWIEDFHQYSKTIGIICICFFGLECFRSLLSTSVSTAHKELDDLRAGQQPPPSAPISSVSSNPVYF
jgi:hypothetical protein